MLTVVLASVPTVAMAGPGHGDETAEAPAVDRTIEIEAKDMSFVPESIEVRPGETIRFVVTNTSEIDHEFAVDTPAHHSAHREEMREMMHSGMSMDEMMHEDATVVSLPPGETGELVVTIENPLQLTMACNLPGHFEAGMHGSFVEGQDIPGS